MAYESLDPLFFQAQFDFDRINPLYHSLEDSLLVCVPVLFNCGPPIDYIHGTTGTLSGTVSVEDDYQAGTILSSGAGGFVQFGNASYLNEASLNTPLTIAILHAPSTTGQTCLWSYADTQSNDCPCALIYSFTANSKYAFWNDNAGAGPQSTETYGAGTRNFVVGRRDKAGNASPTCDLFINGRFSARTTSTTHFSGATGTGQLSAINQFGAYPTGYTGLGNFGPFFIWQRALSNSEIFALSDDPYGMFRPYPRTFVHFFSQLSGTPPSTASLAPDSIAASTNFSGTVADIDEDPDSPDASWLTATSGTAVTDVRVTFPSPGGNPIGSQNFNIWLRKTTGASTPTVDVQLYQGGSLIAEIATDTAITSTSGQLLTATWNASQLVTVLDGSDVECRIVSTVG